MPFAGFELNPTHTAKWAEAIGKFMVNFGGVEWTTFLWIDLLSKDPVLREIAAEAPLSRRIDLIRRLLDQHDLPKKLLNETKSALGKAEKLSQLRNNIAHNPVTFGWHGPEEARPPDFIGTLNVRKFQHGSPRVAPVLEFSALNRGIDDAAALAQKLYDTLQAVSVALREA